LFRLPRFENEIIERLFVSKQIIIIGGGVIGLSAAWYCQQRGHQVTVIDRQGAQRNGCSFGNAGMIVPSHIVPLAAPGMIRLGLKWIWNPRSPFYIRPRASWELLAWLWQFKQSCTPQHVDRAAPLLRDLHLASRECFDQLQSEIPGGFGLVQEGLLMLCRTAAGLKEETEMSERARDLGLAVEVLDAEGTAALDPAIEMDIRGAVYYPQDCFLSPNQLMAGCKRGWRIRDADSYGIPTWKIWWSKVKRSSTSVPRQVISLPMSSCSAQELGHRKSPGSMGSRSPCRLEKGTA
jgi:glycine/D-amino acid oxidase-like deaminating enzyme